MNPEEFNRIRADTIVGMAFSNLIPHMSDCLYRRRHLHASGKTDIQTSAQAAEALRPIAGKFAEVVFALPGIVGAGCWRSRAHGATAYAVGEGQRWPVGLARKPKEAAAFCGVLALSAGFRIALNFTSINPISALYWSAVISSVLTWSRDGAFDVHGAPQGQRWTVLSSLVRYTVRMALDRGDAAQRIGDGGGVLCWR